MSDGLTHARAARDQGDRCPRFGKFFRGCKFEPRYSRPAFTPDCNLKGDPETFVAAVERMRPVTYEGDVCIRCGKRSVSDVTQ